MSKNDNEVLVRVEGVSKKFCRSLKKSLWYGVCDIAGELFPFGKRQRVAGKELRVTGENQSVSAPATSYPLQRRQALLHPLPATLYSEGSAFGLGLRAERYFVRDEARGGARHHRAEWSRQIHFAQDSFAGHDAVGGADLGAGADCFVAGGGDGVQSGIDGAQ